MRSRSMTTLAAGYVTIALIAARCLPSHASRTEGRANLGSATLETEHIDSADRLMQRRPDDTGSPTIFSPVLN